MATREPLYREIADLTVDTDGRKVRAVANDTAALAAFTGTQAPGEFLSLMARRATRGCALLRSRNTPGRLCVSS
jgi:hypothetical protein